MSEKNRDVTEARQPFRVYAPRVLKHLWLGCKGLVPSVVFLALTGVLLLLVFSDIAVLDCRAVDIRILGLVLQLFGFITVAIGLRQAERVFNRPSVFERIGTFISDLPKPVSKHYTMALGTGRYVMSGMNARATLRPGPNSNLERRVEILEGRSDEIHKDVSALETNVTELEKTTAEAIEEEAKTRESTDSRIERMLSESVVGGIHIEWYGLVSFIVGIILAGASPELAELAGHSECQM